MKTVFASWVIAMLLSALSAACAETVPGSVRVFTTESACFEFLFTGMSDSADGKPVLSFNHRNDRTYFVRPGEQLGPYRITAFESKTNRVFYPSLNASLDKPSGRVILAGPGNTTIILEQDQPLPWPGRTAWLVKLNNGAWWNINEEDIFLIGEKLIFVEEIDEDGVVITVGQDLAFIQRITTGEKEDLQKLWAEKKHDEELKEEIALLRREDEARAKAKEKESTGGTSYMVYNEAPRCKQRGILAEFRRSQPAFALTSSGAVHLAIHPCGKPQGILAKANKPGTQVEIRRPPRFFYGTEYRFPTSFKICPGAYTVDGRFISVPFVIPANFETRYCGMSINAP